MRMNLKFNEKSLGEKEKQREKKTPWRWGQRWESWSYAKKRKGQSAATRENERGREKTLALSFGRKQPCWQLGFGLLASRTVRQYISVVLSCHICGTLLCSPSKWIHWRTKSSFWKQGDQPWDFFGRNDAKAEAPVLWPPHAKSWLIRKDWCWEGLGAGGEGDDRGWDGWMASLTRWTWVWVNSGSWWRTGMPGVLRFMGLQRVRHDWATELNWNIHFSR